MILGREIHDWDIATSAKPNDIARLFHRVIPTGIQHGTVTVMLRGNGYEVTTLRGDGTYSDGRHPDEVTFVDDLEQDLARRDFTINAIAFDPLDRVLIDPFGGCADIEKRQIRAVGTPQARFQEDGLRILRAARFAATLEFAIVQETLDAMAECSSRLLCVSNERVRDELFKTLGAPRPSSGLRIMQATRVLDHVLPEALPCVGCEQNKYHLHDVWEHTLHVVDACRKVLTLRIAALLHDLGKPSVRGVNPSTGEATFYNHEIVGAGIARQVGERLRFSNDLREHVAHLVRHHLIMYEPGWSASAVRRWVQRVGAEHVDDLLEIARADSVGKREGSYGKLDVLGELRRRLDALNVADIPLRIRDLVVDGRDLMVELGLPPGPLIGRVLNHLLELVVDDPDLNRRDALLDAARSYVFSSTKSGLESGIK